MEMTIVLMLVRYVCIQWATGCKANCMISTT